MVLGLVAAIVLIVAVASSASNNSTAHQSSPAAPAVQSPAAPTPTPVASSPAPSKPVASAPAPAAAPAVLFTQSGSGTATTANFTVPTEWNLMWHYDCANLGFQGNFIASIEQQSGHGFAASFEDQPVDQLGASGTGVEHYHYGGSIYLSITSECSWTVQALRA